jgi:hypothetical protein
VFFPRVNVDSTRLATLTPKTFRYVSERREWNARGRQIPLDTPGTGELEMVPIESYFKMEELEVQRLMERVANNQALFRQIVGVDVPQRIPTLALANYRRLEVDTFTAWGLGQVSARNPVNNAVYTATFGFDAGRYQTAGTPWTGGVTGNAYANLVAWLTDAQQVVPGGIAGVMLRLTTRNAIRYSAPNLAVPNSGIAPLLRDVEARISDEIGSAFRFFVNERTVDIFTNAGTATTPTKLWPASTIAVIPADGRVGTAAFAPVARVAAVAAQAPEARIDVRGQSVFIETGNNGRDLTVECQVNALPIPEESKLWLINVGI